MWQLGHLSDCPGFHGIHRENRIALRTNAENRTISLYTCRGNQIHILKHCGISLKGVYPGFFSEKSHVGVLTYFNQGNQLSITYQYKKMFIFLCETVLSPHMLEKFLEIRF